MALLGLACTEVPSVHGDDLSTASTTGGPPSTGEDEDEPADPDGGEDTGQGMFDGVVGLLLDPTGQPLPDSDVLCCTSVTCYKGETEDDGAFSFTLDPGWEVAVKTHEELFETPRWAAALVPSVTTESGVDVGVVYIPDLPAGVEIGDESEDPQTLGIGDGLELTFNRGDLIPDLGVFLYDFAARRIPDAYVPAYAALGSETVVAVYAIHPFATVSTSPVVVRAPSTLPAGTVVNFRTINHFDGVFTSPVSGTSDGSFVTTDPGDGISLLTYLVISTP